MDQSKSDQELVKQFQKTDGEKRKVAFSELYRRHERNLRGYFIRTTGNPEEARDLTQEAFRRAMTSLDNFEGKSTFKTYLYRIATYTWRDQLRKKRPSPGLKEDQKLSRLNPVRESEERERIDRVQQAVKDLPEKWRAPLVLVRFEQMQYRDAAKVLNISTDAVRMRLHRAHKALKEQLKETQTE